MKKFEIGIFIIILVCAILLRFPLIIQGFFAFTYDQGRDLLEVQKLAIEHDPILIGPTTGLPGIFYGPWWYYFLGPIFLISGGNPTVITAFFGAIGVLTIFLFYLLIKKITGNVPVSLAAAAVAAMSQPFITSSSQIWSPSLVIPLMLLYVFSIFKLPKKSQAVWYFILGLTVGLIMDSGAAFGIVLTIATLAAIFVFRKQISGNPIGFFAGLFLILLPRIIFDIRHEFLITKSIIQEIQNPHIYQQKLAFVERLINRADLFLLNFAQTFSQSRKILSFLPLVFIIFPIVKFWPQFKKDNVFKIIIFIISIIYLLFAVYPDAVWGYYLVGLPVLFMTVFAIAISHLKNLKMLLVILAVAVLLNFNFKIFSPFAITWQGDGAIWRNQKMVIDDLKPQLQGDYSMDIYTPALHDYPFEYLINWYARQRKIMNPKEGQKILYLIIRDDSSHSYIVNGWYGDRVRSNKLLNKKEYRGSIIVEKYQVE